MTSSQQPLIHLSDLLAKVEHGEEFVVARGDLAVARLLLLAPNQPREFGFLPLVVPESFFGELPENELAAWDRRA